MTGVGLMHELNGWPQRLRQFATFMANAQVRFYSRVVGRSAWERTPGKSVEHVIAIQEQLHGASPISFVSNSVASGLSSSPSHLANCSNPARTRFFAVPTLHSSTSAISWNFKSPKNR